jgi:hypothetical protein
MRRRDWRRPEDADSDGILEELSKRQYLAPHRSVSDVLNDVQQSLGFCPHAAATALDWLKLNPAGAIGRLRRSELIQIARSIHRFWRQALADDPVQSQPA